MEKETAIKKLIASMYTEGIISIENDERIRIYLDWMYEAGREEGKIEIVRHNLRPVNQYDTKGRLLGKYKSIQEAADANKCSRTPIYNSIWHSRPTKKRHIWKYAEDEQNKNNN